MTSNKQLVAIDPGANGGIVWRDRDGVIHSKSMPKTDGDLIDLLRSISLDGVKTAILEKVGGFTGRGQPGSAMFNFGRNYGLIQGVLMAFGFRLELVTPQAWQKTFSLGTVKTAGSSTKWKNKIKGEAQRLYPDHKITLSTSDAFLIFEHGARK